MKKEGSLPVSFLLIVLSICLYLSGENMAYIQIILCHIKSAFNRAESPFATLPLMEDNLSSHIINSKPKIYQL